MEYESNRSLCVTCGEWWSGPCLKNQAPWIQTKNTEAHLKIICPVWCLVCTLLEVVAHEQNIFLSSINPFSYLRTVPPKMWEIFSSLRVPCSFRWFQIWSCWNERDEKRTRNIRLKVWPSMRETRRDVCHSSNATINDLRWLRSRMYSSSTPAALENQTALSQHAAGHVHLFLSCRWRFIYFVISHRKIFCLRFVPQHKIPKGSPQHDVSSVTWTHLMFPSLFLCVFACMRFRLVGFWLFLFRNGDFWLKDHLRLRG